MVGLRHHNENRNRFSKKVSTVILKSFTNQIFHTKRTRQKTRIKLIMVPEKLMEGKFWRCDTKSTEPLKKSSKWVRLLALNFYRPFLDKKKIVQKAV